MSERELVALVAEISSASVVQAVPGAAVGGITNDSRTVRPGFLYAALPGERVDGHSFIQEALDAGATAILCGTLPEMLRPGVVYLKATNPRYALSEISDAFYCHPSRHIDVVGITGTDGKTSTVYFAYQLLHSLGANVGFLSTAAMELSGRVEANQVHQSTPEAPEVHRTLAEIAANGKKFALLESTSHGLSAKSCRLAHVAYRGAVLTNLTREHLEFHGSLNQYRHDKANLFRALGREGYALAPEFDEQVSDNEELSAVQDPGHPVSLDQVRDSPFGVANRDDPSFDYVASQTMHPVLSYSPAGQEATLRAGQLEPTASATRFVVATAAGSTPVTLPVPGGFNVANVLAAMLTTAALTGCTIPEIARSATTLQPVRGRMSVVQSSPFTVVVDYAHTPGSFASTLPFFRHHTEGRLIVLFGSAGERDLGKRPIQGRIAGEHADIIVLSNEDPRGEDQMAILQEIASGITSQAVGESLHLIPDRREAIRRAIELARPGDTLLLLGKGHETSIIGPTGSEPWDEIAVANEELARAGLR